MLDKKTEKILYVLNEQIGTNYKVVEKQTLMQTLNIQKDELAKVLNMLKQREYITVNYQDKDDICLAMTLKAQTYFVGKEADTDKASLSKLQLLLLFVFTFAGAFFGAFFAILLAK